MFCGLCVEVCPTDAVFFTRQFEGATFEYRTLIREFISAELYLQRLQLAEEAKKKAKEKKDKTQEKESQAE
jgi:formate hydrogenlyase subunit 6/NADH:ubiquinone oxidoreductase subunit I